MMEELSCKRMLGSLSDYVDGDLAAELCAEIERHLETCHNCTIVVNTLRRTIELYQQTASKDPLPVEVRSRLFACLELEDYLK